MLNDLFPSLNAKTTIIVPNRRLSINLQKEFANFQKKMQKIVWEKANILSLDSWLQQLINSKPTEKILLNNYQEQAIWEKIIAESKFWSAALASLNAINDIAKEAQTAWKLLRQWDLSLEQWNTLDENSQVFKSWAEKFIKICQDRDWIDNNSIINELIYQIKSYSFPIPEKITLINFDQIFPQLEKLLSALKTKGCKVNYLDVNNYSSKQKCIKLSNPEQEIKAMSFWAKEYVTKNPKHTIGCIVPELKTMRSQVEYIFNQENEGNFDISIGKPLADFPIIYDALEALNLVLENIHINTISRLLRSPFFAGSESEMTARTMLDKELRRCKEFEIPIHRLLTLAKDTTHGYYCPILANNIDACLSLLKKQPKQQSYTNWSKFFAEQLRLLGWGREYNLDTYEYQLIERWVKLLTEFITLDLVEKPTFFNNAFLKLKNSTLNCIFQPKLSNPAPIKILGVLEAAGLNFDALWIMGLTDEDWPPTPKPNPFIPLFIQKELAMPHVNAERELEFCRILMRRFARSAANIIYSYPSQNKEREYQPSPLISPCKQEDFPLFSVNENLPHFELEAITDNQAPSVKSDEPIRGGTKIFKLQAACPFRAFAECRLQAQNLDRPKIGLDYLERGNLIHAILTRFWHTIDSHKQLTAYTEQELQTAISDCIEKSLTEISSSSLNKTYLALEKKRLQKILFAWLTLEKSRPNFQVIAKEQEQEITIANLTVRLRIDRIDLLPDGALLIIDYKTGEIKKINWEDELLNEPQLPLYCITNENKPIGGAVFAQIKNGKLKFLGITKENYKFAAGISATENWHELITKWRINLEKIGKDFYLGNAAVNPKYGENTCKECSLLSLCRKNN